MNTRKDVLFINLPSAFTAYAGSKLHAGLQIYPLLSFAMLAAVLREKGARVSILDLGLDASFDKLDATLEETKPEIVGITATTPLFFEASELSRRVRKKLGAGVKIILGGPHATALPEECLLSSEFDIVVYCEGEETIAEIWDKKNLSEIKGIYYKKDGKIFSTGDRGVIENLDSLPMPALDLYAIKNYRCSRALSRESPISNYETSRGCPSRCSFCNKNISGRKYRMKSPEKVIEELKYILSLGVKELRFIDDQFNANPQHAKEVCEAIIREGLHFPWSLAAGIRVNCADVELLKLAKRAGCYQVGIGFESGDQDSLDSIDKDATIEESIECMQAVKKAGLESIGFFMLGLPADTEKSLNKTINFAIKLMPDLAKITITIPFPGTHLFEQYEKQGLIKTRDWTKYNFHNAGDVYRHPNLDFETLMKYYLLFYRKFYLNPKYISRRFVKSLLNLSIHRDIYYALQTFFPKLLPHR